MIGPYPGHPEEVSGLLKSLARRGRQPCGIGEGDANPGEPGFWSDRVRRVPAAGPEELAAFENDAPAGVVLARAAAGLFDADDPLGT